MFFTEKNSSDPENHDFVRVLELNKWLLSRKQDTWWTPRSASAVCSKSHVEAEEDEPTNCPRSQLRLENKLLLYKTTLKPIWTYGRELWGTASNSKVEILQRYQFKTLRMITSASWFMTNKNIHKDLDVPMVRDVIRKSSTNYLNRLSNHSNILAITLLDDTNELKRLKRLSEKRILGLAVSMKQQQDIAQLVELSQIISQDEDEDDVTYLEANLYSPERPWICTHFAAKIWTILGKRCSRTFFKESFRVDTETFGLLVSLLNAIQKQDTCFRLAIPLEKRIAIALYALGSSAEYRTIGRLFGVSASSVCNILHEFCKIVIKVLGEEYLPSQFITEEKVNECVSGFENIGFPQCLGAVDGCHIEVSPPSGDAVDYFNYKGWYSIVLFALVDYRYRFLYVNVGCPGRCNDSYIYRQSELSKMIESSPWLKRKTKDICGTPVQVLIIGDSAFKFSPTLMKPYPFSTAAPLDKQTFNYGLSKARRVVENAFGHMKARFRRIGKGLENHLKFNNKIIMCCCILHNFLNCNNSEINENWRVDQTILRPQPCNISADFSEAAEDIRSSISKYLFERRNL
ncbi:uncharacterized protein LOC142228101 [Haematobia irritans]|uniref:uncharacterized protein LOC142228101 n=1 Tax=Haematobia irritans TaxID=7368 RepID=UPI003F50449E